MSVRPINHLLSSLAGNPLPRQMVCAFFCQFFLSWKTDSVNAKTDRSLSSKTGIFPFLFPAGKSFSTCSVYSLASYLSIKPLQSLLHSCLLFYPVKHEW